MINALSQASALNPGADLWVVADLDHSRWTAKIDWYLNLQIVKASRHKPPELSDFLKEAIEKTGLPKIEPKISVQSPLLIESSSLLPNKWVLVHPFQGELKSWIQEVMKVWQNLQKPSLRLFLPTGHSTSSVSDSWFQSFELEEVSLVLDLSH